MTFKEGVRSRKCAHIALMLFLGIFYGIYIASVYKSMANGMISDFTLTVAGSLGSVCNGCSRIFWSMLQDKFGFRKVYFVVMTI